MAAMFNGGRVPTKSIPEKSRNPADCGDADPCHIWNTAIGEILLEQTNDLPAIDQCLQLGRRAKVFEKIATFSCALQADHRFEKGILVAFALAGCVVPIGFHDFESVINVVM